MFVKRMLIVLLIIVMGIVAGCSTQTNEQTQNAPKDTQAENTANAENENKKAANFPTKDIRVVVPYNPGGSSDSTARKIADIIKKENLLPVNVNVVNLPGANTRIGLEEVLNAEPDGHTLLLHHSTLNAMNAVGQIDISYEDYELIAQVAYTPNVLVGHANSKYKTFEDYLEAAKKNPGSISVGIPNVGSTTHLGYEALMQATGNQDVFEVVPFQSGADLIAAHLGGQVDLRMSSTPDSIQYVESGDVIPLVTSGFDRHFHPSLKDALSFSDLGLDTGVVVRFGFYAPKGTPKEVVDQLEEVLQKVASTDEFKKFAENSGQQAEFLSSEEFLEVNEKVQALFNELAKHIDLNQ